MAHVAGDRILETTTTTGTGTITLAGAQAGYRAFSTVATGNGDTFYYAIAGGTEWEVGLGTRASATTFTRTTVLSSSNGGAAVSFSPGDKDVWIDTPAGKHNVGPDGSAASPAVSFWDDPDTGMYRIGANTIGWSIGGTGELRLDSSALAPVANDGLALGTTSLGFADLHLAAQGVINWANGEITITETSANLLTIAGGVVAISDTTAASSTTTGALTVGGGMGVAGAGFFGGALNVATASIFQSTLVVGHTSHLSGGQVFTVSNAGQHQVEIFPNSGGNAYLQCYNRNTSAFIPFLFQASEFSFNQAGNGVFFKVTSSWQVQALATSASTSTTTGALYSAGGLGVAGAIFAGGTVQGTSFQVGGTKVVGARDTGFAAMTGSADEGTTYDTATVTLPQLAGRVMALQAALTTHGLIGA